MLATHIKSKIKIENNLHVMMTIGSAGLFFYFHYAGICFERILKKKDLPRCLKYHFMKMFFFLCILFYFFVFYNIKKQRKSANLKICI